jgi:hypothetical protein
MASQYMGLHAQTMRVTLVFDRPVHRVAGYTTWRIVVDMIGRKADLVVMLYKGLQCHIFLYGK